MAERGLRFVFLRVVLCIPFLFPLAEAFAKSPSQQNKIVQARELSIAEGLASCENNEVNRYLSQQLKIPDPAAFNLTLRLYRRLQRANVDFSKPERVDALFFDVFSRQSVQTLVYIFDAFQTTEYNNGIVLGQAGVGKTFLLDQITALYSLGLMPEYLQEALHVSDDELLDPDSIPAAFFGKTDVFLINEQLLSHPPESKGQPWAGQELRMKAVLTDLFDHAKKEYKRTDENKGRTGRRTLFVFEEFGNMPRLVMETLKTIQDESGFKDPGRISMRGADPGFSSLSLTTPDEYRRLVRGDSAVERRNTKIIQPEPSEDEAFAIVRGKASEEWENRYRRIISDDAIRFIIHNRKFLTSPPLAMSASVLQSTNALFIWKRRHPGEDADYISLLDAQEFLMRRAGLTDVWFDGPNGEPPFYNLEERVRERFKDNNEVVSKICNRIKTWARLGMSEEVPVFIIGGPTGSGKDTLLAALNWALFGHDGKKFNFSIAGERGFGLDSLITGPPLGNHSDEEQGLLVRALDEGYGHGVIGFNEAYDTPSEEFDKLKVLVEQGAIRPKGLDSRERPLRFPMFIMGQFGEDLFENKSELEIDAMMGSMTQRQIDDAFTTGKKNKTIGAIPIALLDRAKNSGGVYLLGPAPRSEYPGMMANWFNRIAERIRKSNQIQLDIDPSLTELLSAFSTYEQLGPRALRGLAIDFTEGAISAAQDQRLPRREVRIRISVEGHSQPYDRKIIVEQLDARGSRVHSWSMMPTSLARFRLACGPSIVANASRDLRQ